MLQNILADSWNFIHNVVFPTYQTLAICIGLDIFGWSCLKKPLGKGVGQKELTLLEINIKYKILPLSSISG